MAKGLCPVCGQVLNTYAKRGTGEAMIGLHYANGEPCKGRGQKAKGGAA